MLSQQSFYEVRQFSKSQQGLLSQINSPSYFSIFIHKRNQPKIQVRAIGIQNKIHGWKIQKIEVSECLNDNSLVFHWKERTLVFQTDIILTILPELNQHLCNQILGVCKKVSPRLKEWVQAEIEELFLVQQKGQNIFECESTFLEVKSLYRLKFHSQFKCKAWKAEIWNGLLEIAKGEKIRQNDCYGKLFDRCLDLIAQIPSLNTIKYQNMFISNIDHTEIATQWEIAQKKQLQKLVMKKYKLEHLLD